MASRDRQRVLMGLIFFPRGGSAQIARALARELPAHGWETTIVAGSLGGADARTNAERFYAGLDVHAVDYTAAVEAPDPLLADPPMHPSYEDRPDAPDRVFASVDDAAYEHLVAAWARELETAGAAEADVLHLHHLTPLHEAAARVAPDVPVVSHIHGTELLMLEEIADGPPPDWPRAEAWAERMRGWAGASERLILLSESQRQRVDRLLGVEPGRCVAIPNGFDPATFNPRQVDRLAHWRRHLVDEPKGWGPGGEEGSVAYSEEEVQALSSEPVLLYVGRFTAVKRVGLLVRAHARARRERGLRASLVLLGGFPGEWEGEHPLEAIEASGAEGVFLAGWHEHPELPGFLAASDVVVLPSVREQFGAVLVEGMACGLPAIGVNRFGPAELIDDGETGWLVEPDDEAGLAAALAEATDDDAERRRRGEAARAAALERYSWPALAGRVAEVFEAAAGGAP